MFFDKLRKRNVHERNNEDRPVKLIKTGHNTWQIVYAD